MLNHQTPSKTWRQRSRIRKESHPINRDSFSPESNLKTAELSVTTTSKRNQHSTWSSDSEVVCRSSLRLWLARPLPSTLNHQTPLKTSRLRFKIRRESHPINKDSSLQESNWKTEEPSLTTTFKRSQLFTWSSDLEEETDSPKCVFLW